MRSWFLRTLVEAAIARMESSNTTLQPDITCYHCEIKLDIPVV